MQERRKVISGMLDTYDKTMVAVSGGKDSVTLLHILARIENKFPHAKLWAVTVDEGIDFYQDEALRVAEENLGAPEKVWGFTLPFGATVNMDGMAACIGTIAVFSSNLYETPITLGLMLQFLFVGLALSIGTAGVKGGGIVMSTILLQTIGLPTVVIIPILASIWPVLDICRSESW